MAGELKGNIGSTVFIDALHASCIVFMRNASGLISVNPDAAAPLHHLL